MSAAENGGRRTEDGRPSVAVVDYDAGNLTSVLKGLVAAGARPFVTRYGGDIVDADGVVIPGVGHFSSTRNVDWRMREALQSCAIGKPILGICLGLQFLFAGSDEAPQLEGLGLLPGRCALLRGDVKVPHVGWNTATLRRESDLLEGVGQNAYFYFTHSYAAPIGDATIGVTTHGTDFSAIVDDGRNVSGVQFHPEKSGEDGMRILRNFVARCR